MYSRVRVQEAFTSSTTETHLSAHPPPTLLRALVSAFRPVVLECLAGSFQYLPLVCEVRLIPDSLHPSILGVCVCFLERKVHLYPQVANHPALFQCSQLVAAAGLLLAVKAEDGPQGCDSLGGLVVTLDGLKRP